MYVFLDENVHSFISLSKIYLQLERLFKLLVVKTYPYLKNLVFFLECSKTRKIASLRARRGGKINR